MKHFYSFREIREAELRAMEGGETVSSLMERAGAALAAEVERRSDEKDVLFVCGGGNNGGDGFVAARLLLSRGRETAVLCVAEKFSEACRAAKEAYERAGGEVLGRMCRRRFSVAVDCLYGTGLSRPAEGEDAALVGLINAADLVIACDVPTGLTEGGISLGPTVKADVTVTMGLKQALLLADGADVAGEIVSADIFQPQGGAEVWEDNEIAALFPQRRSHSNKGDYGRAAILAGYGSLGAPFMTVGACLKSGAGYTELWLPQDPGSREMFLLQRTVLAAKYPACIVNPYEGEPFSAKAVAFGMGAGVGDRQRETLERLLSEYRAGTLVLDADALNILGKYGTEALKEWKCPVIVTPHIKEFSRLSGMPTSEILSDPVRSARTFAAEYGVTVVLKNNRTVITDGERTAINLTGAPALAKGGSGDVLSGLIAGSAARGLTPFESAVAGCYLLGRAGELASKEMGDYAPDASDILAYLPKAFPRSETV